MSDIEDPGSLPFSILLKQFRQRAKFNQLELAYAIGKKNRGSIQGWEGELYLPNDRNIVLALARVLRLTESETNMLLKAARYSPAYSTQEVELVWYIPYPRNPHFTGRDDLLDQINQHFKLLKQKDPINGRRIALTQPQAIKGLGGIGKTQIAVEYAYRAQEQGDYTHTLWVNAASEETIMASFVAIADRLPSFSAKSEADQLRLVEAIKRWLEECKQWWLLIFDNADDIALIGDYLPQRGNGSILFTTRANAVGSRAISIEVDNMGFIEGTHLLLHRAQRFERASDEEINQAGNIATALDYFPLALDQAGAYIEETQCSFVDYLQIYQNQRKTLLNKRGLQATNYPDSVATTWSLAFQKIEQTNPAAAELLRLCSFLAPDNIPEEILRDGSIYWDAPLQQATSELSTFNQMIEELLKFSLVHRLVDTHMLSIHRLVQAVQMDAMKPEEQHQWAEKVIRAVNELFPRNPADINTWPQCLRYLDQAQVCSALIDKYALLLTEGADVLNLTSIYLNEHALDNVAEPLVKQALAIREQQLGLEHADTAACLNNLALLYKKQGRYEEAEPLLKQALAIWEQQLGPESLYTANCLNNLSGIYEGLGRYEEGELLCQQALTIFERVLGPKHPDRATCLNNLASLYFAQGKYESAEFTYLQTLTIREQQLGSEHPDTAVCLNNLAALCKSQGRYAEAEQLYQRSLAIHEHVFGSSHPNTAGSLSNLALLYECQGKSAEAEPLLKQVLTINEQRFGSKHPSTVVCLNNLALLYKSQGRYAEAEPLFQQILMIREHILGLSHPDTAKSMNNLASIYKDLGKYPEAEPLYQQALTIWEQLGSERPDTALGLNNLAGLYESQGRYAEAEPLYQQALVIQEKQLGPAHPATTSSLNNLAALYYAQGKYEKAELFMKRAVDISATSLGTEHFQTRRLVNNYLKLLAQIHTGGDMEVLLQALSQEEPEDDRNEKTSQGEAS
jgi:tetratricopeptide (TPR) repeat protein